MKSFVGIRKAGAIMAEPDNQPATVTAHIDLNIAGRRLQASITVPTAPVPLRRMLPVIQGVADASARAAADQAREAGKPVSCGKGCAACCRHLVLVTPEEARQFAELVEQMPEPRQSQVRGRFAAARRRAELAGLLPWLSDLTPAKGLDAALLNEYFALGSDCPFLEDEACSVYADRPLICREYQVITPAAHCVRPRENQIMRIEPPVDIREAFGGVEADANAGAARWAPLFLALEWPERGVAELPPESGPEWLRRIFAKLTDKPIPLPP